MNGTRFDPHNGSLRLTPSAARGLADLVAEGGSVDDRVLDELRAGGLVVDGELHPRLVPVAACLATPLARLRVDHAVPTRWVADGWVDGTIAVLMRSSADASVADVIAVPRGMVALNLARAVRLGPRERVKVDEPAELDEALLEAILGSADGWSVGAIEPLLGRDDEIVPEWLEALSRLSNEPKRRWRMGTWWNSPEESPAARLMEVVESDSGSFLVTHRREPERRYRRARLHPLTSTQLWRLLCGLVPRAEEVDRPLVD